MVLATHLLKDINFVQFLAGIICVWILGCLWKRTLDNLTYKTLKLNKNSTYDTFIVAASSTIAILVLLMGLTTDVKPDNNLICNEDKYIDGSNKNNNQDPSNSSDDISNPSLLSDLDS